MRSAYRGLALLICLGVLVQAAAVAFGWFDVIADLEDGAVFTEDSEHKTGHAIHGMVGFNLMPLLGLLLLITSFFTKVKGASKWAGFVLLAIVLQVVMAIVSFSVPAVGLLHGLNAFVIFGLALVAARRAAATTTAAVAPAAEGRETAGV
jgi:hypothetical protein